VQLKQTSPLVVALVAATSTLLGSPTNAGALDEADWEVEASALYYRESDDRVQDASVSLRAARTTESGQVLVLGLTADTLTGATPTGAVPLNQARHSHGLRRKAVTQHQLVRRLQMTLLRTHA